MTAQKLSSITFDNVDNSTKQSTGDMNDLSHLRLQTVLPSVKERLKTDHSSRDQIKSLYY